MPVPVTFSPPVSRHVGTAADRERAAANCAQASHDALAVPCTARRVQRASNRSVRIQVDDARTVHSRVDCAGAFQCARDKIDCRTVDRAATYPCRSGSLGIAVRDAEHPAVDRFDGARVGEARRLNGDGFAADLKAQGVPTAIYYAKSLHQQTAFRDFPAAEGGLPVSEKLSSDVISLPMHAYLDEPTQERIIKAVRGALSS